MIITINTIIFSNIIYFITYITIIIIFFTIHFNKRICTPIMCIVHIRQFSYFN